MMLDKSRFMVRDGRFVVIKLYISKKFIYIF